ncbi:MAG: protein with a methyltransferase domain [Crocinitomicaceae bacterium]|jgi:2-polyprenyl-3-methyl-5-hydroxy-6-metoxy-1,4-benzoquinol methylase|nr:protein with a methyltransferase domain [Crocinitomicaceae bacterium]
MENFDRQAHWEKIYDTKALTDVSWYQPVPETSLAYFRELEVPASARIMDAGGGDSFLADHLLDLGYNNLSVLDISSKAIDRAKERLGEKTGQVHWIVSDIAAFDPQQTYDVWHDRAVFHFLTEEHEIRRYVTILSKALEPGGILILGTFSEKGPLKCSGIPIRQHSENSFEQYFGAHFEKIACRLVDHPTPFDTVQNFIFCSFRRKAN